MDSDEVLEARIAWPGVTASSSAKTACLICIRSGTASTTKSTSPKPSYSVVPLIRPLISELAVGVVLGDLLLLHEAGELSLRHLPGLLETLVDELLLDVLKDHREAGRGDRLCNLASHRAGAHDGGFEYVHLTSGRTGTAQATAPVPPPPPWRSGAECGSASRSSRDE